MRKLLSILIGLVLVAGLILPSFLPPQEVYAADDWQSPTGHIDPDTKWINEANAYDDDTATFTTHLSVAANTWSSYLEFTHASLSCDKIRFWALHGVTITEISVDVYYSAGWHNIYEGTFADEEWVEKAIGTTEDVTAARVKFYNDDNSITVSAALYEFDFHEVAAVTGFAHSFGVIIF